MDFHIAGTAADFHILSTHTAGPDDTTPLQLISAARLADLERIEAAAKVLSDTFFVGRSQKTASIDAGSSHDVVPTNSPVTAEKSSS